jgi:TPR repeat protein
MYFKGKGVAQDLGEAVRWTRKAADQGYANAQFNLGVMVAAKAVKKYFLVLQITAPERSATGTSE